MMASTQESSRDIAYSPKQFDIDLNNLPEGVTIIIEKGSSGKSSKPKKLSPAFLLKLIAWITRVPRKLSYDVLFWPTIFLLVGVGSYYLFEIDLFKEVSIPTTGITQRQKQNSVIFPLQGHTRSSARLTSKVGDPRPLGCRKNCRTHDGNDYVAPGTMKAIAISDGYIARPEEARNIGLILNSGTNPPSVGHILSIVIEHKGETLLVRYVHLDAPVKHFKPGESVKQGQLLAEITRTWAGSSAPHLHLEVYGLQGNRWSLLDSEKIFDF
jgi:murein DD-endopeptidase MepM/ murein hydrolase activator NlpD